MSKQREIEVTGHALYESYVFDKGCDTNGVINLKAHPFEEESRTSRAPVDIIAVIDISGSMSGSKLDLVRQTLNFVLDQLKPDDRIALITFHSSVKVEMTLTELTATGKNLAKRITSELRAQGGTFLSGGLIEGLQLLLERSSSKRKNEVASLLFLTDGQATDGIRTKEQLQQAVQDFTNKIPDVISINTFGFGADHDSDLLRAVSDATNGMFYFIEKTPDIAQAFADCLGGLLSTVAQKIVVEVEAAENVTITALHSTYKVTTVQQGRKYTVALSDLFGDEERDIVLELRLPSLTAPQENSTVVQTKVQYHNLITKAPGHVVGAVCVNRTATEAEKREANISVLRQIHRLGVTKALKLAAEAGIRHDFNAGQTVLQTTIDTITRESPRDEYSQKLVSELKSAQSAMQNTHTYATTGYAQMQAQQVSQQQQRSNFVSPMYANAQKTQMQACATIAFSPQPSNTSPTYTPTAYNASRHPTNSPYPPVQYPTPSYTSQPTFSNYYSQPPQMQQMQTSPQPQIRQQMQQPPQQMQQMQQMQQLSPPQMQQQQMPSFDFTNNSNNMQQVQQMQQQAALQRQNQQQMLRQQQQQQQLFDFTVPQQQQSPLAPQKK